MKRISTSLALFLLLCIGLSLQQQNEHVVHGLFGDLRQKDVFYYGFVDLAKAKYNIISSLNVGDVGDPRRRKYEVLPMSYDPSNELLFLSAPNERDQTILSVINATNGVVVRRFTGIDDEIVSLQYDIFNKKLFAHVASSVQNLTQVVEIDPLSGQFTQVLGQISGAKPTDMSSYCPICRKYFLILWEKNNFVYVAVNTSGQGGISWRVPIDFAPLSIRFTYKTFLMYSAYRNRTHETISQLGILDRNSGTISRVVGVISNETNTFVGRFSAFDIAKSLYYVPTSTVRPFASGISYVNVNTSETVRTALASSSYDFYAWFIKQFVQ